MNSPKPRYFFFKRDENNNLVSFSDYLCVKKDSDNKYYGIRDGCMTELAFTQFINPPTTSHWEKFYVEAKEEEVDLALGYLP